MGVHENQLGGHNCRQDKNKVEKPCSHQVVHKDHVVDNQHQLLIHDIRDVIVIEHTVLVSVRVLK